MRLAWQALYIGSQITLQGLNFAEFDDDIEVHVGGIPVRASPAAHGGRVAIRRTGRCGCGRFRGAPAAGLTTAPRADRATGGPSQVNGGGVFRTILVNETAGVIFAITFAEVSAF